MLRYLVGSSQFFAKFSRLAMQNGGMLNRANVVAASGNCALVGSNRFLWLIHGSPSVAEFRTGFRPLLTKLGIARNWFFRDQQLLQFLRRLAEEFNRADSSPT